MFRIPEENKRHYCYGTIRNNFSKADNIWDEMKALVESRQSMAKRQVSQYIEGGGKLKDIREVFKWIWISDKAVGSRL